MTPLRVTLYGNPNCGLCAQAEAMLERISHRLPLEVLLVEVDSDPELQRQYVFVIPVVLANNGEVARAPIYETALEDALRELISGTTET